MEKMSHFASISLFLVLYSKKNGVCTCNKAYRFVVLHQSDELFTSVILGIEPRAPPDLYAGWYLEVDPACFMHQYHLLRLLYGFISGEEAHSTRKRRADPVPVLVLMKIATKASMAIVFP